MQHTELFKYTASYANQPSFRNVLKKLGAEAFDDLIDPQDDDLSPQDNSLAQQLVNNIRPVVKPKSYLYMAIESVFSKKRFFPTRYGDGTYPVWYGSLMKKTTFYETAHYMIRHESGQNLTSEIIERPRLVFKVNCSAILIDLTRENPYAAQLIDPNSYGFTHQVGKRIQNEGHPGLISPSARHRKGVNLAIFSPRCLSGPELVEEVIYRFDPVSMHFIILNKNRANVLFQMDNGLS